MLKRLIAVWIDYRIHHISEVIAKCLIGAVLFSLPVAPVAARQYTTHHKPSSSHKTAVNNALAKSNSRSSASNKVAAAKPPEPTENTPPVSSAPPVQAPKTIPVPATQPAPGTGAKKLTPDPAPVQSPQPDNSPPSDPNSNSPPNTSTPSQTPNYATGGYTSTNWSGYVATAGNYKHISSSWVAPNATGNGSATTADSTWIGIGGIFSDDLIQTGTLNIVSASGAVSSVAFYELLPDTALEITSISVSPGDVMSATIDEISAGTWSISINDTTSGQNFTTTVSYTSSYSSAEWIEEDPSYASGSLVPFDHFSPAKFTNGKVTISGVQNTMSAAHSSPITLVDQSGNPLARPTTLSTDGTGFTVYRQ